MPLGTHTRGFQGVGRMEKKKKDEQEDRLIFSVIYSVYNINVYTHTHTLRG